jgi:hypothetical protein
MLMPFYAYNLEMAIYKFWQVNEVTDKNEPGQIQD